MFLTVVKNRLS